MTSNPSEDLMDDCRKKTLKDIVAVLNRNRDTFGLVLSNQAVLAAEVHAMISILLAIFDGERPRNPRVVETMERVLKKRLSESCH